jgi:hypothetical protein
MRFVENNTQKLYIPSIIKIVLIKILLLNFEFKKYFHPNLKIKRSNPWF